MMFFFSQKNKQTIIYPIVDILTIKLREFFFMLWIKLRTNLNKNFEFTGERNEVYTMVKLKSTSHFHVHVCLKDSRFWL